MRRAKARRTVVLVTIDTLRADRLGAYGRSPSITPELDKFAARGVVFEKAWTTAPITVAAHATLLTGLLPPKHGLRVNQPSAPLPPAKDRRFATLAERLREAGFATGAFVSASVLRDDATGLAAGFDVYDDVPRATPGSLHDAERRGEETVAKALDWAKARSGAEFVWVHLFDPHAPYDAPVGWGAGPSHVGDATGYDAEVAYADHCVGLLLDGLAQMGRDDATVCVVADHGESLGEHGEPTHGYLLHEATLHVPLLFTAPGLAPGRRAAPVSTVDVFPTLLSLADAAVPQEQINGAPLFQKARADRADRPLYAESLYGWHACRWAQTFALRHGDEKVVLSGPRRMKFDLAADPREERAGPVGDADKPLVSPLMDVARSAMLASAPESEDTAPSGSYWSVGGAAATPVLTDEENAKLPSPYDRMDVLAEFDRACLVFSTNRFEEALALFEKILVADPGNLQTGYWRGRSLEKLERNVDAAQAMRTAFEMGFRSPRCVVKALQCSLKAMRDAKSPAERAAESDRAARFVERARGLGVREDAESLVFECRLHEERGEWDAAEQALRRAEKLPHDASLERGVEECKALLNQPRNEPSPGK